MMKTILSVLFSIVVLFPFIWMFLILVIYKRRGIAPSSVLGPAADMTTPLLFLSVYVISQTVFGNGVGYYIVTIAIIIMIIYSIYEKMNVKELRIIRLLRKIWRLFFLILVAAYFILLIIGVIVKIIAYAS